MIANKSNEDKYDNVIKSVKYRDIDMKQSKYENKPVNLGVPVLSENVEKVLSIPLGFRLYKNINLKDFEIEIEECFAKMRLNKQFNNNDGRMNETISKNLNFNNMRATDTKFNKRVYFASPDDVEFETKSSNLTIELLKRI